MSSRLRKLSNWLFWEEIDHRSFLSSEIDLWKNQKDFWLVLGWGSARGIIHIGVVDYLIEHRMFPCEIVGTSMGAIVGACFALWFDPSAMKKLIKDFSMISFIDMHVGEWIIKWDKVLEYLNTLFDNKNFEDCLIPLKVVATDVDNGKIVVLDSGNIAKAVRASMSLPWILAPVKIDGYRLIDGGMIANLPIQYCSCHTVIASSTLGVLDEKVREWKKWLIFNNFFSYVKANKDILTKTLTLLIHQNEQVSLNTPWKTISLLQPKLNWLGFADFHKYNELVKKGYEEAENILRAWM